MSKLNSKEMDLIIPLDALRDRIAEAVAGHVKAQHVPAACVRLGIQTTVEEGDSDEAFRSKRSYVKRRIVELERAELLPGVREVWGWLTARRVPAAIVSNNHSDAIRAIMNRLALPLPEVIVGREQVSLFKPDPEGLQLALSKLGLGTEGVWMVGDSIWDVEAGAALDLQVALVASPWEEPAPSHDDSIERLERIDALIAIWREQYSCE